MYMQSAPIAISGNRYIHCLYAQHSVLCYLFTTNFLSVCSCIFKQIVSTMYKVLLHNPKSSYIIMCPVVLQNTDTYTFLLMYPRNDCSIGICLFYYISKGQSTKEGVFFPNIYWYRGQYDTSSCPSREWKHVIW